MSFDQLPHAELARRLRTRATDHGRLSEELLSALVSADAERNVVPAVVRELADQIAADSARVTDAQVAAVETAFSSQQKAFEVILAASVGAGLGRWHAADQAITAADHAAS